MRNNPRFHKIFRPLDCEQQDYLFGSSCVSGLPSRDIESGWTLWASPRPTSMARTTAWTSDPAPPTTPACLFHKISAGATCPVQESEETAHVKLHNKGKLNEYPVSSWTEDAGLPTDRTGLPVTGFTYGHLVILNISEILCTSQVASSKQSSPSEARISMERLRCSGRKTLEDEGTSCQAIMQGSCFQLHQMY